jgi:hypothetical protein
LYRPLVLAVEKTRVALSRRTKRMPCPGYTYGERKREGKGEEREKVRKCSCLSLLGKDRLSWTEQSGRTDVA